MAAELVSVGAARLLLRALDENGFVYVERRELVSARPLVFRGHLVRNPWVYDRKFGEMLDFGRFSLTASGRRLAKRLAKTRQAAREKAGQLVTRWRGLGVARMCPSCRCLPARPCTFAMRPDAVGECVPAGVFDLPTCSRCAAGLPALPPLVPLHEP